MARKTPARRRGVGSWASSLRQPEGSDTDGGSHAARPICRRRNPSAKAGTQVRSPLGTPHYNALKAVAFRRQAGQPLLKVEKPSLPAHPILPAPEVRESDRAREGEVLGSLQLFTAAALPPRQVAEAIDP